MSGRWVFASREPGSAQRIIALAESQGTVQDLRKYAPGRLDAAWDTFLPPGPGQLRRGTLRHGLQLPYADRGALKAIDSHSRRIPRSSAGGTERRPPAHVFSYSVLFRAISTRPENAFPTAAGLSRIRPRWRPALPVVRLRWAAPFRGSPSSPYRPEPSTPSGSKP